MPKTEFLQIRLTPEDRRLMDQAAEKDHLDTSTWARQILLRAVKIRGSLSDPERA